MPDPRFQEILSGCNLNTLKPRFTTLFGVTRQEETREEESDAKLMIGHLGKIYQVARCEANNSTGCARGIRT